MPDNIPTVAKGQHLDAKGKGGFLTLWKQVLATLNMLTNPTVRISGYDANGNPTTTIEAAVVMGPSGWTIIIPANAFSAGTAAAPTITVQLWTTGTVAALNTIYILQSGTATGTYVSMVAGNTNSPDSGINWIQIGTLQGQWQ